MSKTCEAKNLEMADIPGRKHIDAKVSSSGIKIVFASLERLDENDDISWAPEIYFPQANVDDLSVDPVIEVGDEKMGWAVYKEALKLFATVEIGPDDSGFEEMLSSRIKDIRRFAMDYARAELENEDSSVTDDAGKIGGVVEGIRGSVLGSGEDDEK
jgi:hypothetical protein